MSGDGGAGGRLRRLSELLELATRGVPIREVAIRYSGRTRAEGRKIGPAGGVAAVWTLVKFRFVD